MQNENTVKISNIINAFIGALNISDMRKLSEVHQDGWKEFLNGSASSQLAADRKAEEAIKAIVEAMPESSIDHVMRQINN